MKDKGTRQELPPDLRQATRSRLRVARPRTGSDSLTSRSKSSLLMWKTASGRSNCGTDRSCNYIKLPSTVSILWLARFGTHRSKFKEAYISPQRRHSLPRARHSGRASHSVSKTRVNAL